MEREAFYLSRAIAAATPDGAAFAVEGSAAGGLASLDRAQLDRFPVVVLLSTRGLDRQGRERLVEYVRRGHGMLVAAGPDVDADVAAGALGGAVTLTPPAPGAADRRRSLAPGDVRHPVFQAFGGAATLGLATFRRVVSIAGESCRPLARFTTGETALLECLQGGGRVLVLASDLDSQWNDFPRHASFVPFVQEALRFLGGAQARTGEYLIGNAPGGVAPKPGITGEIVVNVDPAESDPERQTAEEFAASITTAPAPARAGARVEGRQQEEQQHVWQYVLGLMVAVLVVESLVSARTG
jgi:hypothetical protein